MPSLPVHPLARSAPLHGSLATRLIERTAAAGLPDHTLMQRAGQSIARLAVAIAPHARTVWLACGPGNNGGDGLEAAAHLVRDGRQVIVTLPSSPDTLPADARIAWQLARSAGVTFADAPPALLADDLAVDALLGIGGTRPPCGALAAAIDALNTTRATVLAVDLPSGLAADLCAAAVHPVVRADHTLTLLTLKPGLFSGHGRDHAGRLWFDDLSVPPAGRPAPDAWLCGADALPSARRPHESHKGSFGDVDVIGGDRGMAGAAWLAARAAHAAGAGRVFVNLLSDEHGLDPGRPELMARPDGWRDPPEALASSTVVAGCGGGQAVHGTLSRLLELTPRLVLDADALNAIAADAMLSDRLQARADRARPTVLTPHPLEAARLLACTTADVQADRLRAAQAIADRWRVVAVLKGSGTVIARPGQVPQINPTGNASLATAGTGDVLAGWLGGLWSTHGPSASTDWLGAAWQSAVGSVYLHGLAADRALATPLRALDLIEAMHREMQAC